MKNNVCTIYLVRHGRTDWNDKKLVQGHTNIPLNLEGQTTAQELAKEFRDIKFDKIYTSDLSRARETAEIIALGHKLAVETTKALRERNFGNVEGKSHDIFPEMNRLLDSLDDKTRYSYKFDSNMEMENDEEVMNRFIPFLREIAIANPGKTVLVVAHGGPMWMFLVKLGFSDYQHFLEINNLAHIKLESDGVDFFIKETKGIEKREPVL
ncbi:MAG TPA: histidine phosphatase family protein [Patescibacteria group bacterium]|nr:histidine phosphatase family protein [Patescibacteria group bacterium]